MFEQMFISDQSYNEKFQMMMMMMKNYDEPVKINYNSIWSCIPGHLYSIQINGGLGSGKTNVLLNVIKYQRLDIDKTYQQNIRIKKLKSPKELIDYSQTINDVYKNLKDYNQMK